MTRKEFAYATGVSLQTVSNWIASGVIPAEMLTIKPYGIKGHLVEIAPEAVEIIKKIQAAREAQ